MDTTNYNKAVSFVLLNFLLQIVVGVILSPVLEIFSGSVAPLVSECGAVGFESARGWFESYSDNVFTWLFYLFINFVALINLLVTAVLYKVLMFLEPVLSHFFCCALVLLADFLIFYLNSLYC